MVAQVSTADRPFRHEQILAGLEVQAIFFIANCKQLGDLFSNPHIHYELISKCKKLIMRTTVLPCKVQYCVESKPADVDAVLGAKCRLLDKALVGQGHGLRFVRVPPDEYALSLDDNLIFRGRGLKCAFLENV